MPTLKTVTLGCKVNQYETQHAREAFLRLGYSEAVDGDQPDLILVNSCTVTAESEAKSRKIVRRLAKQNPRAEIVVMGCYAARAPEEAAALPGVSEVVADRRELPDFFARRGLQVIPRGISGFEGRHRAWVKIQDGCREKCSYCIVPQVRPVLVSRPMDEVLEEIRRLVDASFAEIVLTGIHLGHYGADLRTFPLPFGRGAGGEGIATTNDGNAQLHHTALALTLSGHRPKVGRERGCAQDVARHSLADLLRRIGGLHGDFRVRLSSIEAGEVTPDVLDLMAAHPQRICPHLHVPMQSGSDVILKKMRRRWPVGRFVDRCLEIRERLDQPALTTDVIVGFPGETDEDFAATCRAVEEIGFSKIHVFRFSPRQGTEAAAMPNRVPQRIHQHRAAELAELEKRLSQAYLQRLVGRRVQVLVEGTPAELPGKLWGTADRYVTVELTGPIELAGRLIDVKAGRVADGRLEAAAI
jgi:threonylcarbamoyladenosine tRNA methylthiotransferase MtaB